MARFLCLIFITILGSQLQAQTVTDALRYSLQNVSGSARSIGVGSSMSALGADFGAISTSPAAVGAYRSSEFVITPALLANRTESSLKGTGNATWEESINKLAITNLGFVIGSRPNAGKWATSNFAIGLNRIADFNQDFYYKGNSVGSITNRFLELAGNQPSDQLGAFEEGLAFDAGVIFDPDPSDGEVNYVSDYLNNPNYPIEKEQFVHSEGHHTELFFSYGANLDEKLLIGLGVSVPIFRYQENKEYIEDDEEDQAIDGFGKLSYDEFLTTSGYGFQFKVGATYKPVNEFSIGVALHTPTNYNMTDDYSNSIEYTYTENEQTNTLEADSPDGSFDYKLKTPWRVVGNMGFIINKSGFITAEVHYVDYSIAEFDYTARGNGNAFLSEQREVNRMVTQNLEAALTLKAGGELTFGQKYRARAGIILQQSPYANDSSFDPTYSLGFGIRETKFYIDLAFQLQNQDEGYIPYLTASDDTQFVSNSLRNTGFFLTTGFKF